MEAEQVEPNVVTFNTLIACSARCKHADVAKALYVQMTERGCTPTDRTFGALLSAAAGAEGPNGAGADVTWAFDLVAEAEAAGHPLNNYMLSSLVTACARAAAPVLVSRAFHMFNARCRDGLRPNANVYSALLTLCAKGGSAPQALQVADQMRAAGQTMDSYSLSALLAACRAGTEEEASAALRIFVAFQTNAKATVVCNAALDLCARQGLTDLATAIYRRIQQPDVITFNTVIAAYAEKRDLASAAQVLVDMTTKGVEPNERTYGALLAAAARAGDLPAARETFARMRKNGIAPNVFAYTSLISACAKSAELPLAMELFAEMKARGVELSVVTYGALLDVCVRAQATDDAVTLYSDMRDAGVAPNDQCYNLLIRACSVGGRLDQMTDIMRRLLGSGGGCMQADTYEAVVCALCRAQQSERAMRVASWMRSNGHTPSATATAALVQACCVDGQVEWAFQQYNRMREAGYAPQRDACAAVIPALCAAGQVERAVAIYDEMVAADGTQTPAAAILVALVTHCCRGFELSLAKQYYRTLQEAYFPENEGAARGGGGWGLGATNRANGAEGTLAAGEGPTEGLEKRAATAAASGEAPEMVIPVLCDLPPRPEFVDPRALGKMYGCLMESLCRNNELGAALHVFDHLKNHQKPPIKVAVTTLAYLESMCRRSPALELRVYDVCAQMRIQQEEAKDASRELVRSAKLCHHILQNEHLDVGVEGRHDAHR